MSHVFISYSHKDEDRLNRLLEKLEASGFDLSFIWFDKYIEGGKEWHPEIDLALKDASVIAVIVTKNLLKSHYCTYEWSWAIGNGTPVIPLIFESLKITEVYTPLSAKQYVNCTTAIPDTLIETLQHYIEILPDTKYLNSLIRNELLSFRILARLSLWFYAYTPLIVDKTLFKDLLEQTLDEASRLFSQKIPDLMVSKSHAFTTKQLRECRRLVKNLDAFWDIFHVRPLDSKVTYIENEPANVAEDGEVFRRKELEPILSFFETGNHTDEAFYELDAYLESIAVGKLVYKPYYLDPTTIIKRTLKDEQLVGVIQEAIETVRRTLSPTVEVP